MPSQIQVANMILDAVKSTGISHGSQGYRLEDKYGWRVLGSGQNGIAVLHPYDPNLVVKISTDVNDGGVDFAAWIVRQKMQGITSVHFPEILALQIDKKFAVIVMEKLAPSGEYGRDHFNNPEANLWCQGLSSCLVVQKFFDECGRPDDLHSGNWMMREGTPVLIDPLYGRVPHAQRWDTYWRDGKLHIEVQALGIDPGAQMAAVRNFDEFNKHAGWGVPPIVMREHDMGVVHGRHEFRAVPQQIKKRVGARLQPMFAVDFGDAEKRMMAHFDDRFLDMAKAMALKPNMVHAMDGALQRKVQYERPALVKDGTPAAIRREKEDHMLRIRARHDHQPHRTGLQRTLLPGQQPRRVPAAWATFVERVAGTARAEHGTTRRATGPPSGLHNGYTGRQQTMVAAIKRFG